MWNSIPFTRWMVTFWPGGAKAVVVWDWWRWRTEVAPLGKETHEQRTTWVTWVNLLDVGNESWITKCHKHVVIFEFLAAILGRENILTLVHRLDSRHDMPFSSTTRTATGGTHLLGSVSGSCNLVHRCRGIRKEDGAARLSVQKPPCISQEVAQETLNPR